MRPRLDAPLGRFTMYRLVVFCLVAILAVADVLSILGLVRPGDAVAIPVSVAVLLLTSLVANRLLALVFRVRPHSESTVITALLLALILPPALTAADLGVLALAALLAVASKYVLAIRRRHVFNPAAAGAFAIGLTGLAFGQWWVGTPWLLPFVAVGAFLVLFRTRRLPLGGTYVVVAGGIGFLVYLLGGTPPLDALWFALASSPVVFFAGFMLSEPLTMPPRRWQQIAEAAVVGVVASVPFAVGPLHNSPEFALLVGNLLAFVVGQRRGIRLEFLGRRPLSPSSWELDFRAIGPVAFRPGQFMEISLPHRGTDSRGWRRTFSIASAPGDDRVMRIGVRVSEPASSFKKALLDLEPGTQVSATAVGGDFLLPADTRRPLLLVAGGIGITPFVGHLEQIAAEPGERDVVLVYAVTSGDDLPYAEQLAATGWRVFVVAPESPELPDGWTWLGPGRLTGDALLAAVPDARRRDAFLSGPPGMVADLKGALHRAGVRRVHTDVFVGY
jgi:ferredoxin-NADP reductase